MTPEYVDGRPKKHRMHEQADGSSVRARGEHQSRKRWSAKLERRRAKADPECTPGYRTFRGYET